MTDIPDQEEEIQTPFFLRCVGGTIYLEGGGDNVREAFKKKKNKKCGFFSTLEGGVNPKSTLLKKCGGGSWVQ